MPLYIDHVTLLRASKLKTIVIDHQCCWPNVFSRLAKVNCIDCSLITCCKYNCGYLHTFFFSRARSFCTLSCRPHDWISVFDIVSRGFCTYSRSPRENAVGFKKVRLVTRWEEVSFRDLFDARLRATRECNFYTLMFFFSFFGYFKRDARPRVWTCTFFPPRCDDEFYYSLYSLLSDTHTFGNLHHA